MDQLFPAYEGFQWFESSPEYFVLITTTFAAFFGEFLSNASLFAGPIVIDPEATELTYSPTMYCVDGFFEVVISLTTLCWMGIEVLEAPDRISYLALFGPYIYKFMAGMIHAINFCH